MQSQARRTRVHPLRGDGDAQFHLHEYHSPRRVRRRVRQRMDAVREDADRAGGREGRRADAEGAESGGGDWSGEWGVGIQSRLADAWCTSEAQWSFYGTDDSGAVEEAAPDAGVTSV